ncbi:uracil-DNA glycosylase family protein [Alsobacter sp. R-9]
MPSETLDDLLARIAACRICVETPRGRPLPHEPRPVVRVGAGLAPVLVCGQAPGIRVHGSGRPFTDPSGVRLREWLGVDEETFYDTDRFAVVPMGFCFPGYDSKGADLPPRRECAATWHDRLFALMPRARLVVALGYHAQAYHLRRLGRADLLGRTLGETVGKWEKIRAETGIYPLPHPSWRNNAWLKRHPWFAEELLPRLRDDVAALLATTDRT